MGTGEKKILIDTGEGVKRFIEELREVVSELKCVIVTHRHRDHVGGVEDVQMAFGKVPVYKFKTQGDPEEFLHVSDGEKFEIDGCTLVVMETPGHTDDSISLYLVEEKAIFTGDIILGTGSTLLGNYSQYLNSMEKLRSLNAEVLYPAHGQSKVPASKILEDLAHRRTRELQVLQVLEGEMTIPEITYKVYGDIKAELQIPAENNTKLYLEHLKTTEMVSEINGKWVKK